MRIALAAVLTLALVTVAAAQNEQTDTLGRSTVDQTLAGGDRAAGFAGLGRAPGEPHLLREELGKAQAGRETRRKSLLYFAQLTDFQLSDEESPARVEFLDSSADQGSPFGAAHRPQEALVPHMTEMSIRQLNAFTAASPITQAGGARAPMDFSITTGDSADNQQHNEVEAVVRLLDGGVVKTNSGSADPAQYAGQCAAVPGGPETTPRYTGVQDVDDGLGGASFWDPDAPAGRWARFPAYPGLMDRAQEPFQATGLAVPSYVTFGNHDGLAQGNQAANPGIDAIARGCIKPMGPIPNGGFATTPAQAQALLASGGAKLVAPDPERGYISKPAYRKLHAGGRDGHGFGFIDPAEAKASAGAAGYYAWSPKPGFRFIAIDTVSEGGVAGPSANGNIDDPQFQWIKRTLAAARDAGELTFVFGHHPPGSLNANVPDEVAGSCQDPANPRPGCDLDPRDSRPLRFGADLRALLGDFPNVVALISGHTHDNRVKPSPGGAFWEIETASEIDFPHQNRLLELMDNGDGTLSLFGTVLDHAGPIAAPPAGTPAAGMSVAQLAALGRVVGYNDPQASDATATNGVGGLGARADRNVEIITKDVRPALAEAKAAAASARRCRSTRRITRAAVVPRRRSRGALLRLRTRKGQRARVDVFQHSVGRRVIGERLVARFDRRTRSIRWSGKANRRGRTVRDGLFSVRYTTGKQTRRIALVRRKGRFHVRPTYDARRDCSLISRVKLERPAFGGRRNRSVGIAVRTRQDATLAVRVTRRGKTVKRFAARKIAKGRYLRLRFDAEGRPRGEYRVEVRVVTAAKVRDRVVTVTRRV